jgi:glycosyltransferase involved in cell wall biosynthesis
MSPRILFVCKQRPATYGASYGLLNSCRFLCNALRKIDGVEANLVEVIDNNYIEREVVKYKATHVFIEALWVVPEKFDVLIKLHPDVNWYVRLHSDTPFLANEGVAMRWITAYAELQKKYKQFRVAPNSPKMARDLSLSIGMETVYAPNVYFPDEYDYPPIPEKDPNIIDIGCFGAIRPLKNQLIQGMAAMGFADEMGKTLRFHVNYARLEQNGDNVYKNLRALFENSQHELVEHGWLSHEEFMNVIRSMDLGLQVSFSETFNIVAADFARLGVPIVVSDEVHWANFLYYAKTTDINSIMSKLWWAWYGKSVGLHKLNNWGLSKYNTMAIAEWKYLLNYPPTD